MEGDYCGLVMAPHLIRLFMVVVIFYRKYFQIKKIILIIGHLAPHKRINKNNFSVVKSEIFGSWVLKDSQTVRGQP